MRSPASETSRWRKVVAAGLSLPGIAMLIFGLMQDNPSAKVNICLFGMFFLTAAAIFRFPSHRF